MTSLIKATVSDKPKRWEPPSVEGAIMPKMEDALVTRPPTTAEIEDIQKTAYEEGFNLGRKEGREKGLKEGQELAEEQHRQRTESLKSIIDMLADPLKQLDDEIEVSLTDMVALLAKHLVRRELKTNPGEIIGVVREVMAHLPIASRHPRIHLNPDDLELVKNALAIGDEEQSWHLEADPLVSRGGCLVESQSSVIDATVEARLAAQISQMMGDERQSDERDQQTNES